MRSRSSVPWTLRGRRTSDRQGRSTTRLRALVREDGGGSWTLGGRRASFLSPHQTTKEADQQEQPEALSRTRTADPSLPAFAITFLLQIPLLRRVCRARLCPRVLRLMYPSGTRGSLSARATSSNGDHNHRETADLLADL